MGGGGGGSVQRPVLQFNELKKTDAQSATKTPQVGIIQVLFLQF